MGRLHQIIFFLRENEPPTKKNFFFLGPYKKEIGNIIIITIINLNS